MIADPFFTATDPLRAENAVAALLVLEDGRYLMQLRDSISRIFYPGHWGCFGGAVERDEPPLEALRRELREELELELELSEAHEFTRFDFDLSRLGQTKVFRIYYEIAVTPAALSRMVLHEGADFKALAVEDLLAGGRVTPYDAFAIWLHCKRSRFA